MNRQSRYFILAILFAALSLGSAPAAPQDAGFYAGLTFGQSKVKDFGCTLGVANCDDKDTAFSLLGGYQFNKNFAVELAYADLGKTSAADTIFELSGIEVSAVGIIPINQNFSVYGKLGMFLWELKATRDTGIGLPGFFLVTTREDGTDLTFGVGLRYSFTRNLALQVQWQRYADIVYDAFTARGVDVDVIGAGLLFRF